MIITFGFFIPAGVFSLHAQSISGWINAIGGFLLGWIALYVINHQEKPNVKRFLERF